MPINPDLNSAGSPWDALFRETTHDLLDYTGRPVRLSTRVQTGIDEDYGDPIVETFHTETTAEVVFRGTPAFARRREGLEIDIDAVAWIKDDVEIPIGAEAEAHGSREPTRIHVQTERDGGHLYKVYHRVDEMNGKIRLHCVLMNQ